MDGYESQSVEGVALSTVTMTRTGRRWTLGGLLRPALTMAMVAESPAALADTERVASATGNCCSYSKDIKKLACVEAKKDYLAAKAAALATDDAAWAQFLLGRLFDTDQYNTTKGSLNDVDGRSTTAASLADADFSWSNSTDASYHVANISTSPSASLGRS